MNDITLEKIRKNQIIEAALKKITEVGIQNITMDDIAEEAGFSKGGIAYYFSSKDQLIQEAFREFFDRIFIRSKETMDGFVDPLGKILSFGWLYNWDDPVVNIGYRMLFDCMSMAGHNAEYQKLYHEWVENWISLLSRAIDQGIQSGEFPKIDVDETARAISAIYHGFATRWYLDRGSHSSEWAIEYFKKAILSLMVKD